MQAGTDRLSESQGAVLLWIGTRISTPNSDCLVYEQDRQKQDGRAVVAWRGRSLNS
jgi:hypothetical protein